MTTLRRDLTTTENLSVEQVEYYRENGFVRVRNIITLEEAVRYREAAMEYSARNKPTFGESRIFDQMVNVWRDDKTMKQLTLHANVAAVAEKLAGVSLRLWHDQILIKQPGTSKATEFHQDQPYWPHANSTNPISCWIALQDVPVERGCMSFIPRSQLRTDLEAQNLTDAKSLFSIAPDLQWEERITVPLRAGDCTFHHGRCAHMATPNVTEEARVAHVVICIDEATTYGNKPHIVTDPLNLKAGAPIEGEMFPLAREFSAVNIS